MARPIQYDPKDVLVKAMNIFWKKGYELTSIKDIVIATGLKPGSLYNIYNNKEGIFLAVIELYSKQSLNMVRDILFHDKNYFKNIETFLEEVVISSIIDEKNNGCLLVKTLLVTSHKDKKIQESITKVFEQIELYLYEIFESIRKDGYSNIISSNLAKLTIMTMYGAHVYYKVSKDEDALRRSTKSLLNFLVKDTN